MKTELGIDDILRPDMTELCDDYIERVILPDGMQKIGRLCFYNCSRLSVLELPSDICDVDGDAFMNCTKLYMLVMRGSPKDKSCLKQILSQISTLVRLDGLTAMEMRLRRHVFSSTTRHMMRLVLLIFLS